MSTDSDRSDQTETAVKKNGGKLVGEDVVLSYPASDGPVIDGEDLSATEGKVTALIGPNGSGKSTFLKGLSTRLEPDDGTVLLDGREIATYDTKELARELGLLSQEHDSPTSISVEDLVFHGRYPHRGFFESKSEEDIKHVHEAMKLAGVFHMKDREMGNLSGGQKQLVWIAMAIAQDTDTLLMDEPTTHLDVHHQLRVLDIMEKLNAEEDLTIVVVLHEINQAARYADEMIVLKEGEVQARGTPDEVMSSELLADVFEIEAKVKHDETFDGPNVIPMAALDD